MQDVFIKQASTESTLTVESCGSCYEGEKDFGDCTVNQAAVLASPSGKMILFTKKKITMEMPPLSTVVPIL